jgi:hypothetical protein
MSTQIRVAGLVASAIIASAASAQTAVEWKVSEGGNGHWYQLREMNSTRWTEQKQACEAIGAHLACFEDGLDEIDFVEALVPSGTVFLFGPSIGLTQLPGSTEPSAGWVWVTGIPLDATKSRWFPGEPNDGPGYGEDRARYRRDRSDGTLGWNDAPDFIPVGDPASTKAFVEWSADCNSDGIVDFGQILRGELDDDNANGIPDICETSVTGVIPPSVPSQGGATVTIKGANFPDHPTVLIGGVAATDVVRLSATRITATSPALLPGMASISVNGFVLQEALYIRPECGSDLDQNGTVDTGDISIILLDFGPCYATPSALAAPAPTPLLVPDESTPAPTPPAPQSGRPTPQPRGTAS